jgi:hypothetical protein
LPDKKIFTDDALEIIGKSVINDCHLPVTTNNLEQ